MNYFLNIIANAIPTSPTTSITDKTVSQSIYFSITYKKSPTIQSMQASVSSHTHYNQNH